MKRIGKKRERGGAKGPFLIACRGQGWNRAHGVSLEESAVSFSLDSFDFA